MPLKESFRNIVNGDSIHLRQTVRLFSDSTAVSSAANSHASLTSAPSSDVVAELLSSDFQQNSEIDVCGIALAAVTFDGRPIVGKGVGCVVVGRQMRITARRPANEMLIDALLRGSPIAATFSRPTTHGSIQYKATTARVDDAGKDDYLAAQRQRERFAAELLASAYTPEFVERYTAFVPYELIVIEFTPEEKFDQTPGPAAGARIP